MIQRFLEAKHWQLFMLILVIPMVIQMILMMIVMTNVIASNDPREMFSVFSIFPVLMIVIMFGTYGWQWSVAVGLHSKLPSNVRMNLKHFKIFFTVPIIYVLLVSIMTIWISSSFSDAVVSNRPDQIIGQIVPMFTGMLILFPIALFSAFCSIYCLYFCAKTLRSIELGRNAHFGDYIGEFFLFLFNFIGVWIMQPRINQIAANYPDHPPGIEPTIYPSNGPSPTDSTPPPPAQDYNREKLIGKDHDAFRYDDEFDGIL